ncbi:sulfite exporter TauE/SafE family protein [Natranaerofaba carboxydovora]|uniref:sulfite exporter TauE/SafE family protein n=1 Tax=Natranaerofaba carboxydovora TaxID=2742683 RepID=UPI001F145597|nr:sulfite exporter TauE/SafE family protein [Natranaerofaba carboxydovora]UMZ73713.1 Sulfite exporter TauE/SafE [Natranaerofaba carboxydovora]
MDEILKLIITFLGGVAGSFVNVMAGGGSAITLGTLMLLGLDASVANGTNRIGLLVQNISGAVTYSYETKNDTKKSLYLGLLTVPGALLGSYLAVIVSDSLFENILSFVILFLIISIFIPTEKLLKTSKEPNKVLLYLGMFGIGLYGGFIQAGVGLLIIFVLKNLLQISLVQINMHKVYIVLTYTVPVLLIFGFTGNILAKYAIALALGTAIGAFLSVKVSVKKGDKAVKIVIAIVFVLMAIRFFAF